MHDFDQLLEQHDTTLRWIQQQVDLQQPAKDDRCCSAAEQQQDASQKP